MSQCPQFRGTTQCLLEDPHPRRRHRFVRTNAEEASMTEPTTAEIGLATEMTDAEAIETLVRTDETHLTDDEPETPKQVQVKPGVTEGTKNQRTQGSMPEKFHCLSEIDDGVFVAWDRCHNSAGQRHSIADCKCKGGPTEPPYVTRWRQEWIEKRTKATKKVIDALKKDARQEVGLEPLATTVSDGIATATEAVQAATTTEEVPSDES